MERAEGRLARLGIVTAVVITCGLQTATTWTQEPQATFSSSVAVVPISAIVRDSRRRLVPDLRRDDFEVFENGQRRPIVDFRSTGDAAVSIGLLVDTSGSMRGPNLDAASEVVARLMREMHGESDEAALFTFDTSIRQETPFTSDADAVLRAMEAVNGWGLTSLYDAIAETARQLEQRSTRRRAVVVITDGIDTSSALTAIGASRLVSEIDVPVYALAVVPSRPSGSVPAAEHDDVQSLAARTGGDARQVTSSEQRDVAITAVMAELRHQYFIAIESASRSGWHRLDIRVTRPGLAVRARHGYFAAP